MRSFCWLLGVSVEKLFLLIRWLDVCGKIGDKFFVILLIWGLFGSSCCGVCG